MAERIIELTISYDEAQAGRAFPRFPGASYGVGEDGEPAFEPPVESIHFLIGYFEQVVRDAISDDPNLTGCVVDVLTVDHRTPPPIPTPAAPDPNIDHF